MLLASSIRCSNILVYPALLFFKKKNCNHFLWIGFKCLKNAQPLQGDSLLLTVIKSPIIPRTHLIDLRKMKNHADLGANQ